MTTQTKILKGIRLGGKTFIRVVPGKKLFSSTMVHSVVNRGDVFAVCLESGVLTILPGMSEVETIDIPVELQVSEKPPAQAKLF